MSTSTQIVVQFAQVQSAAADCRATVSSMTSQLDDLRNQLAPMVATWEGDAQAAYRACQAKWDAAAADIRDLLGRIASACDTSAEIMATTEQANANRFA
jgi:6 kDa early secretory antigenic target